MTSQPLPYHGGRLPAGQGLGQFRGVAGPSARTVSARKANGTDWAESEDDVRRLRQRIFEATRAGDLKKVRNPQKLMLRSRSSTLVGVKRVSGGRETAGIGGRRAAGRGSGGGVRPHRP
ncbi:reverse transcriptase N-terminal domain-containing protein [Streptomyces sp. NPDC046631]|uniref:reverse transcriptase N-terminal domain-containing protein n=1 Tax=unclassified Streptomyces TaxID=2593676 RepID=UPI003409F182